MKRGGGKGEESGFGYRRGGLSSAAERTARVDQRSGRLRCQHQNTHQLSVGDEKRGWIGVQRRCIFDWWNDLCPAIPGDRAILPAKHRRSFSVQDGRDAEW